MTRIQKSILFIALSALLALGIGAWAQAPQPSTELELFLEYSGKKFYKFNYPSTSATGEQVVLSSMLACWAPASPQTGDAIESVHIYSHYTVAADSECPSNYTDETMDVLPLAFLMSGYEYDAEHPFKSVVTRSIIIAPDYEGYGVSRDRTHPYLAEEITAKQVVDAVTYGLNLYNQLNGALPLKEDWRSFSIGYSQGGSVALAVQRYIEQNHISGQLHFRGTLCGDGPYDLIATLRYYMDDNGTSYDVSTDHRADQLTLPYVLPMILKGMLDSDPNMSGHTIGDYLSESFIATGIIEWLSGKTMTNNDINDAWIAQYDNGTVTIGGTTYQAPANMGEMFFKQTVPGMLYGEQIMAWAKLDKILTPGFYNYLKNLDNFNSVPPLTGNPYQDMHHALAANNLCTGWEPRHRIQFAHSKGDMVVPYGNYLAFKAAHPTGENDMYKVDSTFSTYDHLKTGAMFMLSFISDGCFDYFGWIDALPQLPGDGTEASPYLITSAADWDLFASEVSSGYNFNGEFIKLTQNISVTTMAGTDDLNSFQGTFDGNSHKLTVSYNTTESWTAPFRHVKNAVIKNLHVDGTINTSAQKAAGFVGESHGALCITNCRSSVAINSSKSGDGTHGGFVATLSGANNTITIDGCVFDGSFATTNGTTNCGGFVGWPVYNRPTITNSLMRPTSVASGMLNNTFARWHTTYEPTITNCYFVATDNLPANQGKQKRTVTAGEYVTVSDINPVGGSTTYDVSGITAYAIGISYGGTFYYGNGDQISLTLSMNNPPSPATGQSYIYSPSAGTLTGLANPYTLLMPDADVIIGLATVADDWATASTGDADDPYKIYNKEQLNLLATRVNSATGDEFAASGYNGKYFKLMNDIMYSHTSDWNNTESDEENYTAIGCETSNEYRNFNGDFDGNGHTVSGIRIFKTGESFNSDQGLFGRVGGSANIHDLTLADTRITGYDSSGGIVGYNYGGTITRCHVANDVLICAVQSVVYGHGGIVGHTYSGSVSHCSSAATLTSKDSSCKYFGAICGQNLGGTLRNNLAIGANVPECGDNLYGAICGVEGWANLLHNYYTACTVAGVQNATNVGCNNADDTEYNGAVPAYTITAGEYVSMEKAGAIGIIYEDVLYAGSGDQVSLTLNSSRPLLNATAYNASAGGELTGSGNPYTLNMPAANTTISGASWVPNAFSGDGSVETPYLIGTTADWDNLVYYVNSGAVEGFNGKYLKLTNDIEITTMAGIPTTFTFRGTFDGDNHTITVDYTTSEQYAAPFQYTYGCTIKNLKTAGTINTSSTHTGGVVGRNGTSSTTLENVSSSVTINSSYNGSAYHGGLMGYAINATFKGCAFTGKLLGASSHHCGGFLGQKTITDDSNATFTDCLFAPTEVTVSTGLSFTFAAGAHNNTTFNNCYYTEVLGDAQGTKAHGVTGGTYVTVVNAGAATNYNVSGITSYGTGIKYNDVLYAGNGDNVSLNLDCIAKPSATHYNASAGTLTGTANPYTLTMLDEDAVINFNLIRQIDGYDDGDGKWAFIASPVNESIAPTAVGNLVAATATEYDLYRLNPSTVKWENYKEHEGNAAAGFSLVNGRGYLYATKETKTLAFTGTYNTGLPKVITGLPTGFNLVGNPFVVDAYVSKPYYTLNDEGSVIMIDAKSRVNPIPPCHGVIVEVVGSEDVIFLTEIPLTSTGDNGNLQMTLTKAGTRGNAILDNAIVSFDEGSELGKFYFGTQSANIYIPQGGKDYAIVHSEKQGEMPLNFKAHENGTYTLTVSSSLTSNLSPLTYLHLIDNLAGADIDLLQTPSYTFEAKTDDYASRFKLVFNAQQSGEEADEDFAFVSNGELIINGTGTLQVIDALGRLLISKNLSPLTSHLSLLTFKPGVYVLRLIDGENVKTQKIVIN
jgi:hypothetical protein